ncbi:COX15/CtaA family protein [Lewinella cohaerens]|uniref:COX15/CtaA family protein n=1 Tax=Lewinella cohaerens TaxID=70995 RepID=UPI0003774273|nr:COX15/CtaA family protein [Lewinella cohaerens]
MDVQQDGSDEVLNPALGSNGYRPIVKWWLVIGVIMIIGQIVIGGITRLTGSGLSITKWEIVTGTLPPLNDADWHVEFDAYKATPQYAKINEGMSLQEFKFIYFWEYFHRLWARLMGFVFAIPFVIFWRKRWLDKPLMKRLGITVLLAAVVASFGWIMVASGLIQRPWVNAYKLTMHLSLACILYAYLLWTVFKVFQPNPESFPHSVLKTWAKVLTVLTSIQIILGGIMSGAKAGLFFPTWPDMNGEWVPEVLTQSSMWNVENFVNYDATLFLPALVQFTHRGVAYILTIIVLYFVWKLLKVTNSRIIKQASYLLVSMLVIQVLLGILTVVNSVGMIPVALGVLHQAGAIFLLSAVLFVDYQLLRE